MDDTEFQPKPPRSLWPIFVGGMLMLALFFLGTKLLLEWAGPAPDEDAQRSAERRKAWAELQAEDAKKLGEFAWADRPAGKVQIPIEVAMQIAAERLAAQRPRPFVVAPAPAAPPPDANPASAQTGGAQP